MVAVARDYSSPTAKHNILPAAAMHTPVPRWVINGHGAVNPRCPLSGGDLNRSTQHFVLEEKDRF